MPKRKYGGFVSLTAPKTDNKSDKLSAIFSKTTKKGKFIKIEDSQRWSGAA